MADVAAKGCASMLFKGYPQNLNRAWLIRAPPEIGISVDPPADHANDKIVSNPDLPFRHRSIRLDQQGDRLVAQ